MLLVVVLDRVLAAVHLEHRRERRRVALADLGRVLRPVVLQAGEAAVQRGLEVARHVLREEGGEGADIPAGDAEPAEPADLGGEEIDFEDGAEPEA